MPKGQLLFWSNLGQTGKKHLVSNNFCAPIFVLLFLYFKSRGQISHVRCKVVTRLPASKKLVPSTLSNWKEKAWKKIRASTGIEPVTSAIPVRCSTNWAMKPHIGSELNLLSSYLPMQWSDVKFIWNTSYLYCSCRWKWRVIIAVSFPI